MELSLGDKVIQILQRHNASVSLTLSRRVHAVCHPRTVETRALELLVSAYLKAGLKEPLGDFMCMHGITMEDLKSLVHPTRMAAFGAISELDLKRLYTKDINSPVVRSCFDRLQGEAVVQLIQDLKQVLKRDWQVRSVLGYGAVEWKELKQSLRGSRQYGDNDRLPWSKAKHHANSEFIRAAGESNLLPQIPLLFETCQGMGDATEKYRPSVAVVAAESDRARYDYAYERTHALPLATLDPRVVEVGQVYMPDKPTSAQEVAKQLGAIDAGIDILDIDPFGSSLGILLSCLPVLKKRALVMITLGDAANSPHGFETLANAMELNLGSFPESRLGHVKDRLSLVAAYRYLTRAAELGVHLIPLLYFRAIQYHRYRITFEGRAGRPVAGVDRLYCLATRANPQECQKALSSVAVHDPWIGRPVLWPSADVPFQIVDFYEDLWDQDRSALRETGLTEMTRLIDQALKRYAT